MDELEPLAQRGLLSRKDAQCIEAALKRSETALDTLRWSHLLLTQAEVSGELFEWDRLAVATWERVPNANLAYEYAVLLARQGPERADAAITWANRALESEEWTGDVRTARRAVLHRVRAEAARAVWEGAETVHRTSPSDESAAAAQSALERSLAYDEELARVLATR